MSAILPKADIRFRRNICREGPLSDMVDGMTVIRDGEAPEVIVSQNRLWLRLAPGLIAWWQ